MADKTKYETELNELLEKIESLNKSLSDDEKLSFAREAIKIVNEDKEVQ